MALVEEYERQQRQLAAAMGGYYSSDEEDAPHGALHARTPSSGVGSRTTPRAFLEQRTGSANTSSRSSPRGSSATAQQPYSSDGESPDHARLAHSHSEVELGTSPSPPNRSDLHTVDRETLFEKFRNMRIQKIMGTRNRSESTHTAASDDLMASTTESDAGVETPRSQDGSEATTRSSRGSFIMTKASRQGLPSDFMEKVLQVEKSLQVNSGTTGGARQVKLTRSQIQRIVLAKKTVARCCYVAKRMGSLSDCVGLPLLSAEDVQPILSFNWLCVSDVKRSDGSVGVYVLAQHVPRVDPMSLVRALLYSLERGPDGAVSMINLYLDMTGVTGGDIRDASKTLGAIKTTLQDAYPARIASVMVSHLEGVMTKAAFTLMSVKVATGKVRDRLTIVSDCLVHAEPSFLAKIKVLRQAPPPAKGSTLVKKPTLIHNSSIVQTSQGSFKQLA